MGTLLEAKVLFEENNNCIAEAGEAGLRDWLVEIDGPIKAFKKTNENGEIKAYLPFGTYQTKLIAPQNDLFNICQAEQTITIVEGATESQKVDFTVQAQKACPNLTVQIGTPFLRRCFENTYHVNYCNNGTIAAEEGYVLVQLDESFSYIESSVPGSLVEGNIYRFEVGRIERNECGYFSITIKIDCESTELGQTHCVKARISSSTNCAISAANWSKASIELESECANDSVRFHIKNIGEGDMQGAQEYIVIQDMILLREKEEKTFQLSSGTSKTLSFAANGATYRLETNQVPNHPQEMILATAIEGCGTNDAGSFSKGFITMFSAADDIPSLDTDCQENRGAYDPNDKNAFPKGYNTAHYIEPNTDINYHIRFQNTGTDTAFNIIVLDTLSSLLDVSTMIPLSSSHPYDYEIVDSNILKYTFSNIMLPDSNINEPASHGFFKFRISQKADVDLGSVIPNSAAIYFDFNSPIITNTYEHTIGIDFIEARVITSVNEINPLTMKISPNPATASARIKIGGAFHKKGLFQLYDLNGRQVASYSFSGNEFQLDRGDLAEGMYLFKVHTDGQLMGTGKLVIK
jgi:uncharacterized repeat protein (TIGR01451 family)